MIVVVVPFKEVHGRAVVVLIQKLQPLFAISLAGVILKEKLSKRFMFLAVIAMFGGYLVTFGNKPFGNWDDKSTIASLCALLASFCWGSSTVLGKHALKQLTFEVVTGMRLFITAIIALIIIAYSGGFSDVSSLRPENYTTIIIIVFSTGTIALSIYYYGLQNLAASHTTIYELAWPLSAVFIDWTLKGKTLSLIQIIGALILLCSMGMLTRENQSE